MLTASQLAHDFSITLLSAVANGNTTPETVAKMIEKVIPEHLDKPLEEGVIYLGFRYAEKFTDIQKEYGWIH